MSVPQARISVELVAVECVSMECVTVECVSAESLSPRGICFPRMSLRNLYAKKSKRIGGNYSSQNAVYLSAELHIPNAKLSN